MGNFWIVPLLHSVSDVTVSYEYDYVSLDVVKGGAFLEATTRAAARPRNLRERSQVLFWFLQHSAQVFGDVLWSPAVFPVVYTKAGACS